MASQADMASCPDIIDRFELIYPDKWAAMNQHVMKVKKVLEDGMGDGAFRAIPISTRIKELDSAQNSLRSRQAARMERQDLRKRMLDMKGDWDQYWKKLGQEQMINDYGPFKDQESLIHALPDFGGVRVCVYFPNDVENVVSCLEQSDKVEILQKTRKTRENKTMSELRSYVNILEQESSTSDRPKLDDALPVGENLFPGYRATHLVVELLGDAIPKYHEKSHYKVEVQIGTVVMHAWSQIEHDIVYKPSNGEPSEDEKRLLDLFNGIVMTGEAALRQLAASTARKEIDRGGKPDELARNHYELGVWLSSYCDTKGLNPKQEGIAPAWSKLDKVFAILRSSGDDKSGKVNDLLDKVHGSLEENPAAFDNDLPLYLLKAKFELTSNIDQFSTSDVSDKQKTRVAARHHASRVVHSINMASYLGVTKEYIETIEKKLQRLGMEKRPSLIDFLDLLHPEHPQMNPDSEESLFDFCEAFLEHKDLTSVVKDDRKLLYMQLPIMLTDIGFIVSPIGDITRGSNVPTAVPRALCRVLYDPEHTNWIPEIFIHAYISYFSHRGCIEWVPLAPPSTSPRAGNITDNKPASPTTVSGPLQCPIKDLKLTLIHQLGKDGMNQPGRQLQMTSKPWELIRGIKEFPVNGIIDDLVSLVSFDMLGGDLSYQSVGDNAILLLEQHLTEMWRTQNGYFEPIKSDPPTWREHRREPSQWTVQKLSPSKFIPVQQTIQKLRRKSQWVDFANRLYPDYHATEKQYAQGSPKEYTFQMEKRLFTVRNLEHNYELTHAPTVGDNNTLGSPTSAVEGTDEASSTISDSTMIERGAKHGGEIKDIEESQTESEP
ncbi:hypothetical protein M434DRAFT_33013 [Hypoxylon sp. CO27-5]|nr:hypothetical protein M434DRAFT_33013 [Hypoxylon sp. CO27-5]